MSTSVTEWVWGRTVDSVLCGAFLFLVFTYRILSAPLALPVRRSWYSIQAEGGLSLLTLWGLGLLHQS